MKLTISQAVKEEFAARLLEENLDSVSEAIQSMNALIAGGMSWSDVEQVVQDEKRQGNYIASLIERLDLESNRIFLRLECEKGSDDDSEDAGEAQEGAGTRGGHFAEASDTTNAVVEVDLSLSAYANASRHFESRKRHEVKRERTVAQSEAAYEVRHANGFFTLVASSFRWVDIAFLILFFCLAISSGGREEGKEANRERTLKSTGTIRLVDTYSLLLNSR